MGRRQDEIWYAAVEYGDKIFKASCHDDCMTMAFNQDGLTTHDITAEGFVTNNKEFVDRRRACEIAMESCQIAKGEIHSLKSYELIGFLIEIQNREADVE